MIKCSKSYKQLTDSRSQFRNDTDKLVFEELQRRMVLSSDIELIMNPIHKKEGDEIVCQCHSIVSSTDLLEGLFDLEVEVKDSDGNHFDPKKRNQDTRDEIKRQTRIKRENFIKKQSNELVSVSLVISNHTSRLDPKVVLAKHTK